ncbi:MAG: aminomethyl-transferring glycine dehydrogenase subunit GcvPB [Clostridiaceae bacterium]|nr:aminomethyl-transferring glycine dehydrogenase subunit GcvPB [Clostridiaceae bacterium]
MKLLFEECLQGYVNSYLPDCASSVPAAFARTEAPKLPEVPEVTIDRHYTALASQTRGVNAGFYPLGSCTMKYNPAANEAYAALPGFADTHPLAPETSVQGCLEVLWLAQRMLCEICGMDDFTMQPAAGAHGEFTGLLLIKAYHASRGDTARTKILVPDSAHGTNPASAAMAGFTIVNVPSTDEGLVDLDQLAAFVGPDTAGLMLTNPNTVGLFDRNILKITEIIHDAGGLCYYDGANLNAVMGIARPGDMGFDVVHVNLHKTFSTPHGGGGPGSGPVGCKSILRDFLPEGQVVRTESGAFETVTPARSIGRVKAFHGNFLVVVRALAYMLSLGAKGLREASESAVLNANYLMHRLADLYNVAFPGPCMHEFVLTLEHMKREQGVSAMDVAKALIDHGIHPPTMYFPLIVHEALMFEPTETETRASLDEAADVLRVLHAQALTDPESLRAAPHTAPIGRPDETQAARKPVLTYQG